MGQDLKDGYLKALGLTAEPSEQFLEAFKAARKAEQADPEVRCKREQRDAELNKEYRRHYERADPGPDRHRGAGNKNAAAYARDHPPRLLRSVRAARLLAMETLRE